MQDLDAEGVTFIGPAVIIASGRTSFDGVSFDASGGATPESFVWEIAPHRSRVVGAVTLQDCSFVRCSFIGIAGSAESMAKFFAATRVE